jgi:hypothetical protein
MAGWRRRMASPAPVVTFCFRRRPIEQEGVLAALRRQGLPVLPHCKGPLDLRGTEILWLQGNARWFPALCRQLGALPRRERPFSVIWHHEPLPPPKAAGLPRPRLQAREIVKTLIRRRTANDAYGNARALRRLREQGIPDLLVVSTRARQEFLAEQGIAAQWAPMGYWPAHGADLGLERDIPVLFLGDARLPRRKKSLRYLRARGIAVQAAGNWSDPAFWGEPRTRLLNRARILLNLQRNPGELPGLRFILGMANRALVVSEPVYRPEPYVPGEHYVSVAVEEMPRVIADYLARDGERERIALAGQRLVTGEVTAAGSVARIVAAIHARRQVLSAGGPEDAR